MRVRACVCECVSVSVCDCLISSCVRVRNKKATQKTMVNTKFEMPACLCVCVSVCSLHCSSCALLVCVCEQKANKFE